MKRIPSPSKFRKSEIRESDYESDYDLKIEPVWRPSPSGSHQPQYKPIKPIFTPTGRSSIISSDQSPLPPTEFERPLKLESAARPKFEPIDKFKTTSQYESQLSSSTRTQVLKPKPVSGKPFAPSPQPIREATQYYTATAGPAHHNRNAVATETCNRMQMQEHTESSHRMVNMMSSKRVIQFDQQRHNESAASIPYEVSQQTQQQTYTSRPRLPPPPTPTKFVPGELRESDYDSEMEAIRIRPIWTPNLSDTEEPRYRRVSAPTIRPASVSRYSDCGRRVLTPMEFDTAPPEMPTKIYRTPSSSPQFYENRDASRTQTLDRYLKKKTNNFCRRTRDDFEVSQAYSSRNSSGLDTTDLSTQSNQFQRLQTTPQPIKPILKRAQSATDQPQIYKEEKKMSQHGKRSFLTLTLLLYPFH